MKSSNQAFIEHPRLGRLPADWRVWNFREITDPVREPVRVHTGTAYREIGIRSHGKGIFHKVPLDGAELGDKRVFWIKPKCLTFNIVFAWEGAVAVTSSAEIGMIGSHRFPMHEPRAGIADAEFLQRFFQTRLGIRLLGDASPGGAGRNRTLNQKLLADTPVPLPPLPEQRKIAAILSSLDDAVHKAEKVIEQLQLVKEAMMQELLMCGLPSRRSRLKGTESSKIPQDWETMRVQDAGEVVAGRAKDITSSGKPRPYLRVANVFDGYIDTRDVLEMPFTDAEFARYELRVGDVLLNEGQSLNLVGRCSMYRGEFGAACGIQNALIRFRAGERVVPAFAEQLFRWYQRSGRFAEIATQTTSIAHLGVQRFSNMQIGLPPLDEQRKIAEILASADARISAERTEANQLIATKSSLMSALLIGELRVTPDKDTP